MSKTRKQAFADLYNAVQYAAELESAFYRLPHERAQEFCSRQNAPIGCNIWQFLMDWAEARERLDQQRVKLSAPAWLAQEKYRHITVHNPDGWDRQNFGESWAEEIDEDEFLLRLSKSTILEEKNR